MLDLAALCLVDYIHQEVMFNSRLSLPALDDTICHDRHK